MADSPEREFEVGMDEAWKANIKRTYDAYQELSLKMLSDAQQFDNQRQTLATQALQNAIETSNMIGKQAIRHGDFALDRQWNLEVSQGASEAVVMRSVTLDDASLKSIAAAVAMTLSDLLKKE